MLREAAAAAAESDSDRACSHLTDRAQTQIVLRTGGRLGDADCSQAVGRALLFLGPPERERIGSLEPTDLRLTGDSGSAVMRSPAGTPGTPMVVPLAVEREDDEWKISGFGEELQGVPGY